MAACSPQRFLANNRNVFARAALTASSVLPVTNQVKSIPTARSGTARVALNGTYTGKEPADYEIEIVDTVVQIPRVSTSTFNGAGSGTISNIAATGAAQQTYTVECADAGTQTTTAAVQIEGVTIKALAAGAGGNGIRFAVDQSTLTFTASIYSLLVDLRAGQDTFAGQGFDWDSAVIDANGLIPAGAHRVAFGPDRSNIHLTWKEFVGGAWQYHITPALTRDVPKGSIVYFVAGGRGVDVTNGIATTESYSGIKTAYDLLYALRTQSALVVVDGVVSNDRSPTGQASRELTLRTDAHAEVSSGSGSAYATGVEGVSVTGTAGTQLVTATCYAVNSGDHPLARLGRERWALKSSLAGDLGTIVTGIPYAQPPDALLQPGQFGLTIPVKLPAGFGAPKGRFTVTSIDYATIVHTPICPVALTLGPDATDQSISLIWTLRPAGNCNCAGLPVPNLDNACLGNPSEGGGLMAYKPDTVARLTAFRAWWRALVRTWSSYGTSFEGASPSSAATQADALANPRDNAGVIPPNTYDGNYQLFGAAVATKSLKAIVAQFEDTLARIDPLPEASPPGYREKGLAAWDTAVTELKADIHNLGSPPLRQYNVPSERYVAAMEWALSSAGIPVSGGADANTIDSGDGCWRDWKDTAYFRVIGDRGEYAPLFLNHPYVSCRTSAKGGVFSTHEFALQVNVVEACRGNLAAGDTVRLLISESSWGATYQSGDQLFLPIVAASPHYLTGGHTGNPVQNWTVHGSVSGPLAPYAFNPGAPVPYVSADLGFRLNQGGIPFAKADRFRFAIEGGHFRWRKDAGAWHDASPQLPIPLTSVAIDAGLSATFAPGAAGSFVAGDSFRFLALQPWAISNTRTPNEARWKWSGSSATYEADLGEVRSLDLFAMLHGLPTGASVVLHGGNGGHALQSESGLDLLGEDGEPLFSELTSWSEALTYRVGVIWKTIDRQARYLKLVIANADGGSIQWPWAGIPVTTALSSEFQSSRGYRVNRPGGNLQGGRFIGKSVSGEVSWSESAIDESDADAIVAMLDHVKENHDEPLLFIPQVTRVDDPVLFARISSDDVQFSDRAAYNQDVRYQRRVSAQLPLEGVWQ